MEYVLTLFIFLIYIAWHINVKFSDLNGRIDLLLENFNGMREYLYEIDPQFDDERELAKAFQDEESMFAGMDDLELQLRKREEGKRTLNSTFLNRY